MGQDDTLHSTKTMHFRIGRAADISRYGMVPWYHTRMVRDNYIRREDNFYSVGDISCSNIIQTARSDNPLRPRVLENSHRH